MSELGSGKMLKIFVSVAVLAGLVVGASPAQAEEPGGCTASDGETCEFVAASEDIAVSGVMKYRVDYYAPDGTHLGTKYQIGAASATTVTVGTGSTVVLSSSEGGLVRGQSRSQAPDAHGGCAAFHNSACRFVATGNTIEIVGTWPWKVAWHEPDGTLVGADNSDDWGRLWVPYTSISVPLKSVEHKRVYVGAGRTVVVNAGQFGGAIVQSEPQP